MNDDFNRSDDDEFEWFGDDDDSSPADESSTGFTGELDWLSGDSDDSEEAESDDDLGLSWLDESDDESQVGGDSTGVTGELDWQQAEDEAFDFGDDVDDLGLDWLEGEIEDEPEAGGMPGQLSDIQEAEERLDQQLEEASQTISTGISDELDQVLGDLGSLDDVEDAEPDPLDWMQDDDDALELADELEASAGLDDDFGELADVAPSLETGALDEDDWLNMGAGDDFGDFGLDLEPEIEPDDEPEPSLHTDALDFELEDDSWLQSPDEPIPSLSDTEESRLLAEIDSDALSELGNEQQIWASSTLNSKVGMTQVSSTSML